MWLGLRVGQLGGHILALWLALPELHSSRIFSRDTVFPCPGVQEELEERVCPSLCWPRGRVIREHSLLSISKAIPHP